jgi:Arc/MetJ-type ribon-helix-helix transcriptional regulator
MAVTVTRDQHGEEIVKARLRSGRYHSPEEVVSRALEGLAEKESTALDRRTATEAVAHIRELRKGIRLNGLNVGDLVREGRKH